MQIERVLGFGRSFSFWPLLFGLACCAIEMMALGGSRFDMSRFGMEAMRASPRQADGMIVAGWCSIKMAPRVVRLYEQIPDPKWVLAMGSCAISGNVWDTYNVVQGIDSLIPVDVYVPGCPPRPEALWQGLEMIRDRVKQSKHAYDGLRRIPARDLLAESEAEVMSAGAEPWLVLSPATLADAAKALEKRFGKRLLERVEWRGELTYAVAPSDWGEVLSACKQMPELAFDQLDSPAGRPSARADRGALSGGRAPGLAHSRPSAARAHRARRGREAAHRDGAVAVGRLRRARGLGDVRHRVRGASRICAGCSPPRTSRAFRCARTSRCRARWAGECAPTCEARSR